ncbi:hypothetical protein [uncultured Algimonas sp.]|uniref:hypothetical protein n=1 Tax=uncultured Algimonas sp. TaxID=1547920 RepID=UPI00261BD37B|nr:hypothetical protein [uncultured Algimonas sp.]
MSQALTDLMAAASKLEMSPADAEAQRRSFVYGNTRIENSHITRDMVDEIAEDMADRAS